LIKQKVKNLLKQATIKNREEVDNEIKEIQADKIMRPIKKDIEQYGYTNGRKLA